MFPRTTKPRSCIDRLTTSDRVRYGASRPSAFDTRNKLKPEPSSVFGFVAVEPDDHREEERARAYALAWMGKAKSIVH